MIWICGSLDLQVFSQIYLQIFTGDLDSCSALVDTAYAVLSPQMLICQIIVVMTEDCANEQLEDDAVALARRIYNVLPGRRMVPVVERGSSTQGLGHE